MKLKMLETKILLSALLVALATPVRAGTNDLTSALQKGLFEEEANHNLAAAIQAYQSVIAQFDKDRKLAATAVFRLGECYRKLGSTNEALAQYQRILREFADQAPLVELSRQRLPAQGALAAAGTPPLSYQWRFQSTNWQGSVANAPNQEQKRLLEEEIKLVEQKLAEQRKALEVGRLAPADLLDAQREILELKRTVAALDAGQPGATEEQKRLIDEEIKLVEQKLAERRKAQQGGRDVQDAIWAAQRDLLELQRHKAALEAGQPLPLAATPPAATSAEMEEIARIREIIRNSPDLINANEGGQTLLTQAAVAGQVTVARYLLQNGADVNATDFEGASPLCLAASQGHRLMAEVLLEHGAAVDAGDKSAETPLHRAAARGFKSVAEVLLANKANVNARDSFGDTPLHKAAEAGQLPLVELLLAHQADVNAKNSGPPAGYNLPNQKTKGATPLVQAILAKQAPAVKLLLSRKAEVNFDCEVYYLQGQGRQSFQNPVRGSPLFLAAAVGSPEIVALLLEGGANPNALASERGETTSGLTPLRATVRAGQKEVSQLLLAHKADPNIPDGEGRTPLHWAALGRNKELVNLLLANHAEVNRQDQQWGSTPLSYAVQLPDTDIAAALLDAKADPNLKDQQGRTPLHRVAAHGQQADKAMVELLLAKGADPNLRDNAGNTPLALAKGSQPSLQGPGVRPQRTGFGAPQPVPTPAAPGRGEIAELLRQHGAVEELPRTDVIEVRRPSANFSQVVFIKGTNNYNRFTLYEVIAAHYGFVTASTGPQSYNVSIGTLQGPLAFPDLNSVTIHHPTADGLGWTATQVNFGTFLDQSIECSFNRQLEWGDVVEIPEADHPINAVWRGLPEEVLANLKRCVDRQVQLTVKGQTTNLLLSLRTTAVPIAPSFILLPVLQSSGLLRASSDLSRVKVKRRDASTGQVYELVFDCSNGSGPDFWLRNGDAIEVPEKP